MLQSVRNKIISKVASRHVAGSDIESALKVCRWAQKNNFPTIISPWSDWTIASENSSKDSIRKRDIFNRFRLTIEKLHEEELDSYLSIKLDSIVYDFGLFKELLEVGQEYNVKVHIDSLDPDSASRTFKLLEKAVDFNKNLGCTLPSRWQRSLSDADMVVDLDLSVRIVKGQWEDFGAKVDCKKKYLAIVEKLSGRAKHVGIATHDIPLAEKALTYLSGSGTNFEMEQFFSLPLNGIKTSKQFGCPYRIYVSFGHPAIPYNYRFALTRPALAAWMISDYAFNIKKPWL